MAITTEETEFLDQVSDVASRLIDAAADADVLYEVWDSRNYSSQIDATDITDWGGHGFSVAQLATAMNNLHQLVDFLDNVAVSTVDRRATLDKVRKLAQ